jgi:hypothetical protein
MTTRREELAQDYLAELYKEIARVVEETQETTNTEYDEDELCETAYEISGGRGANDMSNLAWAEALYDATAVLDEDED